MNEKQTWAFSNVMVMNNSVIQLCRLACSFIIYIHIPNLSLSGL